MDQTFSVDSLPDDPQSWPVYRKTALTHALKIEGPFTVQTSEGPLFCRDGYLALDARGYPYPIATDEFHLIYEMVRDLCPSLPRSSGPGSLSSDRGLARA